MSENITLHLDDINTAELVDKIKIALEKTAYFLQDEIREAQVIPRDTGNLQGESFHVEMEDDKAVLIHSTPYARRLYYHPEYNFSHEHNPNAKGKWFEDWEAGGSEADTVQNAFMQLLRRELDG